MDEKSFHPKAYLTNRRNLRSGLEKRTMILNSLEKKSKTVVEIAFETNLSYRNTLYHINNLKKEAIITVKKVGRPMLWKLSGLGQQRIDNSTYLRYILKFKNNVMKR